MEIDNGNHYGHDGVADRTVKICNDPCGADHDEEGEVDGDNVTNHHDNDDDIGYELMLMLRK